MHSKLFTYIEKQGIYFPLRKIDCSFKSGCTNLENDPREGRPKTTTIQPIIQQVRDMLLDDRRMKVREIVEFLGISKERIGNIFHEELNKKALCK